MARTHSPAPATARPPPSSGDPAAATDLQSAGGGGNAFVGSLQLPYRAQMEAAFGEDFGDLTVVYGGLGQGVGGATDGDVVRFASTNPTLEDVAHEVTHVVQARRRSKKGDAAAVSDPEDASEREATRLASKVAGGEEVQVTEAPSADVQCVLTQPLVTPAPATAMPIAQFIALVEAEEARFPPAEQTNTALMITRLRKIFYNSSGWDEYLIPGAAGVAPIYDTRMEETGREEVDIPWNPLDFDLVRERMVVTDSAGHTPSIASNQEVAMPDGSFVDVGHVFAGLDAYNHPTMVDGPGTINLTSNMGAATWVGDLGSVLGEVQCRYVDNGMTISEAEYQARIDEYASGQDMLGNVDAYAMADAFTVGASSGRKVSELLREYYLGASTDAGTRAREHRYTTYARMVGLTGWTGAAWGNEGAWIDSQVDEVNDAAAMYIAANGSGLGSLPAAVGMSMNGGARRLLELWVAALKTQAAAEPTP